MKYVIDSSVIIDMKHYYPDIFKELWDKFNILVSSEEIISVREAYNEITGREDFLSDWAEKNKEIFYEPEGEEYTKVTEILTNHKELVKKDSLVGGKPVADPFLIAKAYSKKLILLTNETYTKNAHKIPNVCEEYGIQTMNLKEFMMNENWAF